MRRAGLVALLIAPVFAGPAAAAQDPLEDWNRRIHDFNALAQRHVLGPLAQAWRGHVPASARHGIGGVVGTLGEPVAAVSALAAGDLDAAWGAMARFGINATLGWGGWRDAAAERGHARRAVTAGDAACAWGVPSGPYLVLPLLGPTTLRDATAGLALSSALAAGLGAAPVAAVQGGDAFLAYDRLHDELRRVEATALDPYAVLRSAWLQRRAAACPGDARPEE